MARFLSSTSQRAARQRGLSLIELIVFIVVVAIGLVGIMSVLILTSEKSSDPIVRKQGIAVAEAMLEEVLLKAFQNDPLDPNNTSATLGCTPTTTPSCRTTFPENQTDRPNYNDVSDYAGWSQTGVTSLANPTGTPISGLELYTVSVAVAGTTDLTGIASTDAKKIRVTVTGSGETFILEGYRTNY